jgi:hypothetical protein
MNLTITTLTVLLLLLPGVGFIVGVNFSDKNIREIVFRNTPAEIGYVISVSLIIHLVFAFLFSDFNAAAVATKLGSLIHDHDDVDPALIARGRDFLKVALAYCLVTALAGLAPGWLLGQFVRLGRLTFFVKHKWMLDLIGRRKRHVFYGRVLLSPIFATGDSKGQSAITIEGILSDTYFAADGTLLYLVFRNFTETPVSLATAPYLAGKNAHWPNASEDNRQLVVEGKWITMAQYERLPVQGATRQDAEPKMEQALKEDGIDGQI